MKYAFGFVLLFAGIGILIVGIYSKRADYTRQTVVIPTFSEQTLSPSITPTITPSLIFSADILPNNEIAAVETIASHSSILTTLYQPWYLLSDSGIEELQTPKKTIIPDIAKKALITMIPTMRISGNTKFSSFNETRQNQLIARLINDIQKFQFGGLDLDITQLSSNSLPEYMPLLANIYQSMGENKKTLTITISAPEGFERLIHASDQIRINPYRYLNPPNDPLAITTSDSFKDIIQRTKKIFPTKKTIILLPISGMEWNSSSGITVSYQQLNSSNASSSSRWKKDTITGEITGSFMQGASINTVWFENVEGIREKIHYAQLQGFTKFSFLYIGGEDTQLWENKFFQ